MSIFGGPSITTSSLLLNLDAGNPKSYVGSGNTWIDVSGRGYVATINNAQTFSTLYGGGITTPPNQVTTFVSVPIQALQSLTDGTVYTMEWTLTVLPGSSGIRYGPHMTIAGGNEFIWVYDGSGLNCYPFNSNRDIGSDPTFTFGVPLMLAVTRNGLTYRTYKNGVFTAQYTNLTGNFDAKQVQSWVLDQEQDAVGTSFDLNQNLNANWHNVKLYNKILSDEEILQNFIANRGRYGL
jgi:hypothetical protein